MIGKDPKSGQYLVSHERVIVSRDYNSMCGEIDPCTLNLLMGYDALYRGCHEGTKYVDF